MTPVALLLALTLLSVGAFWIGKSRSLALVGGARGVRNLHSLPSHYGFMTAMWCALPALAVIAHLVRVPGHHHPAPGQWPPGCRTGISCATSELSLVLNDVRNLVAGNVPASAVSEPVRAAAAEYVQTARHRAAWR